MYKKKDGLAPSKFPQFWFLHILNCWPQQKIFPIHSGNIVKLIDFRHSAAQATSNWYKHQTSSASIWATIFLCTAFSLYLPLAEVHPHWENFAAWKALAEASSYMLPSTSTRNRTSCCIKRLNRQFALEIESSVASGTLRIYRDISTSWMNSIKSWTGSTNQIFYSWKKLCFAKGRSWWTVHQRTNAYEADRS